MRPPIGCISEARSLRLGDADVCRTLGLNDAVSHLSHEAGGDYPLPGQRGYGLARTNVGVMSQSPNVVRFGILGAARIAPAALVRPARKIPGAAVVAVAARDQSRAAAFAEQHGIPRVHDTYDALLADPDVDAIYNPLPNGLHGRWTIAALRRGKHVLCEKPFAANAAEAQEVAVAARGTGLVVAEAFHWRYHPLAHRALEVIASGEIGAVRHIDAAMCFPLPKRSDIRWNLSLAGGATMDAGCYPVSMIRTYGGGEPTVVRARAKTLTRHVDRWMQADLRFDDGTTARLTASMLAAWPVLKMSVRVVGTAGTMTIVNPIMPQAFHLLRVRTPAGYRREQAAKRSTYAFQLEAFLASVLSGEPVLTGLDDAVANMRVIDAIYRAAGLPLREPVTTSGG